jgi:type III restriction enzyme
VVGLNLFEFQDEAVQFLLSTVTDSKAKQIVTIKAPTGAGKTIILIDFIDKYLNSVSQNTAFIWLCPGKGDLEEQSRLKMLEVLPHRDAKTLFDSMISGFEAGSTTFINWELVTKKGNNSLKDSERKNLFDRIADAHRNGVRFMIFVDEEHSNNTYKAQEIIDSFSATHIIRVSATAKKNSLHEFYEIDELDVINAGLITKAIYVNEGVQSELDISNDYEILLDLADTKRKEIDAKYKALGKDIRPLVLIQFPNAQPEILDAVERRLADMGYTHENGMVRRWLSGDKKDIPDNLTENNGSVVFLLMKQAVSTGWDCRRAKILVKLREGMNEDFEIQTIGRIRRMPEAKHYEDEMLDFCYIYTFDEKYKEGLMAEVDRAYEIRRLFIKDKCKVFTLEKEIRDLDFNGLGEREVFNKIYSYLINKYKLGGVKVTNKQILKDAGYVFGEEIIGRALQGEFIKSSSVAKSEQFITTRRLVDTHKNGIELLHAVDAIKSTIGMQTNKVKSILERLFRSNNKFSKKLLSLDSKEFYAFVINNEHRLKEEFREVTAKMVLQMSIPLKPKKSQFNIPEQDFFKYDPTVKKEVDYISNAFKDYTSGYCTSKVRSTCEMLFEKYCESNNGVSIDWVYKNGDTGQQYFSIVYIDNLYKQWLFYPDYIVKKTNGEIWIIETKGGESKGHDKNIDKQIGNKFNAFKRYAEEKCIKWGFVRDLDGDLYIDNTEFHEEMSDKHWIPLENEF